MVSEYTKLKVFLRDKGKCFCGSYELERTPHHCFYKSEYSKEDRNEAWNLVCICVDCHRILHFAKDNEEASKARNLDKRLKETAINRYEGIHREKLKRIYKERFGELPYL